MKISVLLTTTCRWYSTARLAMSLKDAGCVVDICCPDGHPANLTSACDRTFRYRGLAPLDSFRSAMIESQPEIVIPCDDLARSHLHQIAVRDFNNGRGEALYTLLARSLGDPSHFELIDSRSRLIAAARELGIDAPETGLVSNLQELRAWIERFGLPVVLKSDGTSGGQGVRIVETEAEALKAFPRLKAPPETPRALKRAIADRDFTLLSDWLHRKRHAVNVQKFFPGADATIAIACIEGKVIASITVEVLRTWKQKGPASVVRVIDNREMLEAAEKIASRLKLTGLCGFDFVMDGGSGRTRLIEMNPRATQTCHLALGTGRNLPVALHAALANEAMPQSASVTDRDVIALFPLEWQNDAGSPYLLSGYHDVPWQEPRLVEDCVKSRMRNGGRLTYDNLNRLLSYLPWRRS
jgi:Carbamoyl-phosphate synthase L chain, ATP binding domain